MVTVGGQRTLTTPESAAAGHRTVYLPTFLLAEPRHHLDRQSGPTPTTYSFPGNDGRPLTPGQVHGPHPRHDKAGGKIHPWNGFYRNRCDAGRTDVRPHDPAALHGHHGRHLRATTNTVPG